MSRPSQTLQAAPAELDTAQQRAVEDLRHDGLAMVPFGQLVADHALWSQLETEAQAFVSDAESLLERRGEGHKKKDYIVRGSAASWDGSPPPSPLLRFSLSERLLAVVNAYLDLQARLTYVDAWYTAPSPPEAKRVASQRWHRDHIDRRILKTFTYFRDVDEEAGALEYVRGSAADGPYGHLWAWTPDSESSDHYPPDGELERLVEPAAFVRAEAPAGTVVLCDTGGFHRGGFARRPRVTANFTYVSPAADVDRRFEVPAGMADGLQGAARAALA